jgi:beta-glucosidase
MLLGMPDLYLDPTATVDDRADDLLDRMTLSEKVAQLGGVWITRLVRGDAVNEARLQELLVDGIGHVTRIGASTGLRPQGRARLMNDVQRFAIERTRLGIPVVVHEESTGGFCARDATVFPQALGLASSWDVDLLTSIADVIRQQMLAVGARHTLAPVLDIARDPRWGRSEETYGEDPVLAGTLGAAYVRGMQTDDLRNGVICTGKHFLGYGLPEGGRNHGPVQLGPRELREVYAEPFAAAIRDAGLASIMNSYSSVDGLPCAGAAAILDGLLRDELGFDGVVVADYWAVTLLITHHRTAADKPAAAEQALRAGLDLELPALDCYSELIALVASGRVDVALVDRACRRVLVSKLRLGLFEHPYVDEGDAAAVYDTAAQRALARRAAIESIVLLENDGVLPLAAGARVAVLGPAADDVRRLQGDYHYPAHIEIVYEGAHASGLPMDHDASDPLALSSLAPDSLAPGPFFTPHVTPLEGLRAAGVDVTDNLDRADVAVVFVGEESGLQLHSTVGEARDATVLDLTDEQEALVLSTAAQGVPTVVVVISGRVHTLGPIADAANAILWCAPPGEEGGNAIADVLTGRADPGGRLPVSLPRSAGQLPVHAGHRAGGDRSQFHRDYIDSPVAPRWRFGHGRSYTTFSHDSVSVTSGSTLDPIVVTVRVTNTGERTGDEIVQLYGRDDIASVARPDQLLLGFTRVTLDPGEARRVQFTVDPSRLAFYDDAMRFVVEPGTFTLWAGESPATVVTLDGDVVLHEQRSIVATRVEVSAT